MNLRDLKYLVAVAETQHFGRAAERCFVSQPTLSSQIKKLENQLGVTLFERTNRKVAVTPVGEEIISHARKSLGHATAIEQTARTHQDPLAGTLRIGSIPTLSPYLIPLIFRPMKTQFPKLRLLFSDEVTSSLERRLSAHEIDAALLATHSSEKGLEEMRLFDEPFWLVHPRDHPLYTKEEISRADLSKLEILLLSDAHCLSQQVMEVCRIQNRDHDESLEALRAFGLETLIQLVSANFGCTLVPALVISGSWMTGSGVVARKLEIPDAFRRIRLVFRASFPRVQALEAVARVILENLPNTVRPVS